MNSEQKQLIICGIVIALCLSIIFTVYASGQVTTRTIDNSGRREYTYCPLSDSDVSKFGGEIDGCPLARVYIDNWNGLTTLQQQTIDTLLRSKGFVDSGEMRLK